MSSITETSEHKALRDSYTKAFYVTGQHYAGQIGVAFDKGSETTELLLTAQHDKEMESFYNWIENKDYWEQEYREQRPIHFPELLELFRKTYRKEQKPIHDKPNT